MAPQNIDDAVTPLQRMRLQLGWKQAKTVAELANEAKARGLKIAAPGSLKVMVSRWENGGGQVASTYQGLFAAIYDCDIDELGFRDSHHAKGSNSTGVAPTTDDETVDYFRSVLFQHIKADNLMGPHHLVEVVRAQTDLLDDILPGADGTTFDGLLELAFRYNELTGWLYQDAGDPARAMTYSDRAMDYATTSGDAINIAYVLMRKANIACDLGSTARAVGLTKAALRNSDNIPPRIRALILGQQARAYAMQGNRDECLRSLETAMNEVTGRRASSDGIAEYCTPGYVQLQAATCWVDLGNPDEAVPVYQSALKSLPNAMRRDRGPEPKQSRSVTEWLR
jgi:tetratricopeptide (TPR) repeat protein